MKTGLIMVVVISLAACGTSREMCSPGALADADRRAAEGLVPAGAVVCRKTLDDPLTLLANLPRSPSEEFTAHVQAFEAAHPDWSRTSQSDAGGSFVVQWEQAGDCGTRDRVCRSVNYSFGEMMGRSEVTIAIADYRAAH